jgi:peptide/nickel transport system permease protein
MRRLIGQRLLQTLPTLLLSSIAIWAVAYALPGDPATIRAGIDATPEQIAAMRVKLGLDRSPMEQYVIWLGQAVTGDLGHSYQNRTEVTTLIGRALPATLQFAVVSLIAIVFVALVLGAVQALKPDSLVARAISAYNGLAISIPVYWTGVLLVLIVAIRLGWLPSQSAYIPIWQDPLGALKALALPVVAITFLGSGVLARFVSTSIAEEWVKDYVRTGFAKGMSTLGVLSRHVLRNASIPVVTIVGLQAGSLVGGAVIVEAIFNYPGLGRLLISALNRREYMVFQSTLLFMVLAFILINLVIDVLYIWLNPRLRGQHQAVD